MLKNGGIVAGKLAFVTGAGSGIGRATCMVLSREGATVIAADKNLKAAEETIKTYTAPSAGDRDHMLLEVDVGDGNSIKSALSSVLKQYKKPPTIIVNSAGILRDNFMTSMSEMDFDSVININMKGTFLVMQTFAKAMIEAQVSEGTIVNIASIVGKTGNMGQVNYSASKAGVEAMTKTASKELGKFNIRVNAVLPGIVDTPIIATVPDKVLDIFINQCSLRRKGKPEEIAEVITFLSSNKSSFITGASIDVNGGI